jgi:Na+/H+ antiporter NhaD/arsenite permease-like protein
MRIARVMAVRYPIAALRASQAHGGAVRAQRDQDATRRGGPRPPRASVAAAPAVASLAVDLPLVVFAAVYAVMLLGRAPGLALDRTGAAVVGATALLLGGALPSAAAWQAIDFGTLGLLLGMMLVSAQFVRSGFYARATARLAARPTSPERLLGELVAVVGALSAMLTNDVVCVAFAPPLVDVCTRRGLDPVPFLLALCGAANVGSAATLIGNPQNMLIGQQKALSFAAYLLDGGVPAALGLAVVWLVLARAYRGRFVRTLPRSPDGGAPFARWQTSKGFAVLAALVAALLATDVPREVLALAAGALLLVSRTTTSRALLAEVDGGLLLLFAGLFVCNAAFAQAGHAAAAFGWLRSHGVDVGDAATLFGVSVLGSNLVSNVPLTMLLLPATAHPLAGPILALATTLAGNLLLVGSIANLIVVEAAARRGIAPIGRSWAGEHWRTGVPITLATLALAAGWLWLRHGLLAG